MSGKSLRTVDVARLTGVSVNTVRLYEQLGYIPPAPRASNGYRQFGEHHVRHVQMVRHAMQCTWSGGTIRQVALNTLIEASKGDYALAVKSADYLIHLINVEQIHAEEAIQVLETWANNRSRYHSIQHPMRIGEVADRLHVTVDELRGWERNGLIEVARASNGYRMYGASELARLLVIRALRRARYSTMSVLRLMQRLDEGHTEDLREILDSPTPDTGFEQYPTDSWLSTLQSMYQAAEAMRKILTTLQNPP